MYALMTATLGGAVRAAVYDAVIGSTRRRAKLSKADQQYTIPRGATAVDSANPEITPTKNMVMPGQHQFSMKLTGYESWQTVMIRSDTVTQLDYARLVPRSGNIATMRDMTGSRRRNYPGGRYMLGIGVTAESGNRWRWRVICGVPMRRAFPSTVRYDTSGGP